MWGADFFLCYTGHTLSGRRKLCVLGWSWGLPESVEHWHGTRTWSHGKVDV